MRVSCPPTRPRSLPTPGSSVKEVAQAWPAGGSGPPVQIPAQPFSPPGTLGDFLGVLLW